MTESDVYTVMKNPETGAEVYQCNTCDSKYGTKKAIKTHVTTKHKAKKKIDEKNGDKKDDDSSNSKEVSDFEFGEDMDTSNGFGKEGDFTPSTQVEKTVPVEDILRFYESGSSEFINETATTTVIPDDTMDDIMEDLEENRTKEAAEEPDSKDDLFTENVLLKSKLKSAESLAKEKEQKSLETETSLIDANTEVTKLKEENRNLEEEIKLKNEENDLLVAEQNKLEENVTRNNGGLQKMFQERTAMKSIIVNLKSTVELLKQGSNKDTVEIVDVELKTKLDEKAKELEQANKDKRRLAKDLAEAQAKDKATPGSIDDGDKGLKLTNLLKNQKAETKKATDENKRLNTANKELQDKLNKANNELTKLESKSTRLEKQVDDLIETCGQKPKEINRRVSFENQKSSERSQTKCVFNDKGRCRDGSDCSFAHPNVVCKSHSRSGFCEDPDQCPLRHPSGICMHWRRGNCDKESVCFYRHPVEEFGSMKNDGSRTPDMKRKRTFSKYIELTKWIRKRFFISESSRANKTVGGAKQSETKSARSNVAHKSAGPNCTVYPPKSTRPVYTPRNDRAISPPSRTELLRCPGRPSTARTHASLGSGDATATVGVTGHVPRKLNKKKQTRRSKRKSAKKSCNFSNNDNKWSILHNNVRGFNSKKH